MHSVWLQCSGASLSAYKRESPVGRGLCSITVGRVNRWTSQQMDEMSTAIAERNKSTSNQRRNTSAAGRRVGGRRVEVTWSKSHGSTWIGRQRRRRREHTAEGNASLVGRTHGVEKEARMNEGGATLMVELLMAAANHGYGSGGRWREWDVIGGRKARRRARRRRMVNGKNACWVIQER
jgi:hypothetical protein